MSDALLNQFRQMIDFARKTAGNERRPHRSRDADGIERFVLHAVRLCLGDKSPVGSGTGLAFGQPVDLIVVREHGQIDVSSDGGEEVVSSFAVSASVTALDQNNQFRIRQLGPGRRGQRPAVASDRPRATPCCVRSRS